MKCSLLGGKCFVVVAVLLVSFTLSIAVPVEPIPEASWRDLRTNHVQEWFIYNDSNTDGILNPGDTAVESFQNWWTTVSSHSQYNYRNRAQANGEDWMGAPLNAATTLATNNYWFQREPNTIAFYISYSQFDNNDWKNGFDYGGKTGAMLDILKQRHQDENGWVLGYLSNANSDAAYNAAAAGSVKMDIFVHNGQGTYDLPGWGENNSNPKVNVSNDMGPQSLDLVSSVAGSYHPPMLDQATGSYSWSENMQRFIANGMTGADLLALVNSMEFREYLTGDGTWAGAAVEPNRIPEIIEAMLTDHAGNPYLYQDAFRDRSELHDGANDGGLIGGLAGHSDYNPQLNNWGDQQVIRIDIDTSTLAEGIEKILFWDFSDQVNPRKIELFVDLTQTVADGQIWIDDGAGGRIYFPENRVYIAQVAQIPEPLTLSLMAIGAGCLILRRRRHRN